MRLKRAGGKPKPSGSNVRLVVVVIGAAVTLGWLAAAITHLSHPRHDDGLPRAMLHADERPYRSQVHREEAAESYGRTDPQPQIQQQQQQQQLVQEERSAAVPLTQAQAQPPRAAADPHCPNRRPYHVLLTAQSSPYQNWQARIMYFHWKKQRASNPCTDMTNFTRLVASKDGKPDGLEDEIPSIFIKEMDPELLARKYGSFGVLNRPYTVVKLVNSPELMARFHEDYLFIAETDHVLFKDIPNLATETVPCGYKFGYMRPNRGFDRLIKRVWPEGSWDNHDQTGPSPLIIHKSQLVKVAQPWLDMSLALKVDQEANAALGWVLEMWGYVLAAGSLGIKHNVLEKFQIEPANLNQLSEDFWKEYYIYHYTYGIEYTMDGKPMMNTIGEWSLDKRHYGASYPPRNLQLPPRLNTAAGNAGAFWLVNAFNEATAGIPNWPEFPTLGTVGWRREAITLDELEGSAVAKEISEPGKRWTWAGMKHLVFNRNGMLTTPWGEGKWGVRHDNFNCPPPKNRCIYADFANGNHNLHFDSPTSFVSRRVGDGDQVPGALDQSALGRL